MLYESLLCTASSMGPTISQRLLGPRAGTGGIRGQGERARNHLTAKEQDLSAPKGWEEAQGRGFIQKRSGPSRGQEGCGGPEGRCLSGTFSSGPTAGLSG